MTTLILKLARTPQLPLLGHIAKAFDTIVQTWLEARALALKAQRRYPFTVE
jgi:hypothetical protein